MEGGALSRTAGESRIKVAPPRRYQAARHIMEVRKGIMSPAGLARFVQGVDVGQV